MKKLLNLLSVLTISGTAIPTTIAASPYKKQENTNLENLNRNKIQEQKNSKDNKINIANSVIRAKGIIRSSGIILNNKIYFGSDDYNVYEYNPVTKEQKVVISTNGEIWTSGVILNNKIYFGSDDYNVYEYNPVTKEQKVVIIANSWIRSSGAVLNNKIYFGSTGSNVYEYDPTTGEQKVAFKTNGWIDSAGVVLNNKLYIGSADHNVYEYDPTTGEQKVVIQANGIFFSRGIILNNKLYFGSWDHNVYEYNPVTKEQKVVISTNGEIWTSGVILNNKLYFGSDDHNVYEYDPVTGQQKIVIQAVDNSPNINNNIRSSGAVLNNKIYFGSSNSRVYEYDPTTGQQKVAFKTNGWIDSAGVVLNNKLYIGSADYNFYEYGEYYLNLNLEQINDNSDNVILNELNYLNPDLDISQLEIISKTDTSASIKIKNKFNSDINIINVNYSINNELNKVLNLNELIKKAIFFKFRDENSNLKFKEISYIDTNNLSFSNVKVTKKENSFSSSIDIKSICNNKEFINKTLNIKSFNIPACVYNSKYKLTFQLLTGLTKINQENKLNGWNINSDDQMKLTDFISPNYNENSKIINELSNNFNLSNLNKQEQEIIIYYLNEPSDKFELNLNEKLQVNYSPLRIVKSKNILNLKQDIIGIISANIVSSSNEKKIITLSIKESMQILQKYNLLPNEIIINNNNNNITFNGKASIESEIEGKIKQSIVTSLV